MISIITPVLNERNNIEPFMNHIGNLEGDFEVIFVDGGSTDGTLEILERLSNKSEHSLKVISTERGRANQMNKGAELAKGDIFLFLHVDSYIERDSLELIEEKIREGGIIGGGFTHRFSDLDIFLKMTSFFGNLRMRATQIFFGDCGIFIRKDIFERIGGYDDIIFMEDAELCKKAKRRGRLEQIEKEIMTSPRRYESKGKFKLTSIFILACLLNIFGIQPKFLYKYIVEM